MREQQLTHWVNIDGDTVCHLECAIEEQRRLRKEVARLRQAIWDWYDSPFGSLEETAAQAALCDIAREEK